MRTSLKDLKQDPPSDDERGQQQHKLTKANRTLRMMLKAKQRADSGGDATGLLPMMSSRAPTATAAVNRSAALS
eukprot:1750-Heterococcus_DN1.PRE.2